MFRIDSPVMNFLNKVADIMILNVLFLIFCIPVVTIGASFSAAYYVGFKMVKNEESYIIRTFWRAFRENFRQATIMWLFVMAIAAVLSMDYRIIHYSGLEFAGWVKVSTVTVTLIVLMGVSYIFPLQAYFSNTIKNTMKNAFLIAISRLPTSLLLIAVYIVPALVYLFFPQILPAIILLAFGLVIYAKSFLLLRAFKRYEDVLVDKSQEEGEGDPDGGIFAESERIENGESDIVAQAGKGTKVYRDGKFVEITDNDSNNDE